MIVLTSSVGALAEDYEGTPQRDVIDQRDLNPNVTRILGLGGNDKITVVDIPALGGVGNDTIINVGELGAADYVEAETGINANLGSGAVSDDGLGGHDTLVNIRRIAGSFHTDRITGSPQNDFILPRDGNDIIDGKGGIDVVVIFGVSVHDPIITPINGGVRVKVPGFTYTLRNVEALQFEDGTRPAAVPLFEYSDAPVTRFFTDDACCTPRWAVADVTGDGRRDVLMQMSPQAMFVQGHSADASNPWLLMVQQPNGKFLNQANQRLTGGRRTAIGVSEVFFARFNGDGRIDAFASTGGPDPQDEGSEGYPGEKPMLWLGKAGGELDNAAAQTHAPSRIGHDGSIGDVDGNDTIDVYISSISKGPGQGPYFLLNDGTANFIYDQAGLPAFVRDEEHTDVVNNPDGSSSYSDSLYTSSHLFDSDGDGDLDLGLFGMTGTARNRLLINDGAGDFLVVKTLPVGPYGPGRTFLEADGETWSYRGTTNLDAKNLDINGDGRQDLLILSCNVNTTNPTDAAKGYHGSALQILINKGNNVFEDQSSTRGGYKNLTDLSLFRLDLADLDHDGDSDLLLQTDYNLVTGGFYRPGRYFLNTGAGKFEEVELGLPFAHYIPVPRANGIVDLLAVRNIPIGSDPDRGVGLTDTDFRLYKFQSATP